MSQVKLYPLDVKALEEARAMLKEVRAKIEKIEKDYPFANAPKDTTRLYWDLQDSENELLATIEDIEEGKV